MEDSAQIKVSLHITKTNGKYAFSIQDHRHFPLAYEVFLSTPEKIRKSISQKYFRLLRSNAKKMRRKLSDSRRYDIENENEDKMSVINEIGEEIRTFLFPVEIATIIQELSPTSMLLTTNDPIIPWELTKIGDKFLSEIISIGKSIKTSVPLKRRVHFKSKQLISILLIANPTEDLLGADEEFNSLYRFFKNDIHFEFISLHKKEATIKNISDCVRDKNFDIIHFAGHTLFDEVIVHEPKFLLVDGEITSKYFMNILGEKCPPFFFLNSCSSAFVQSPGIFHNYLQGVSSIFLQAGCIAIIGSLWPVLDYQAIEIAKNFYSEISKSLTIGEALKNAKHSNLKSIYDKKNTTWVGYTLIGDPDLKLIDDNLWKTSTIKPNGFSTSKNIFSGENFLTIGGVHPFLLSSEQYDLSAVAVTSICKRCEALISRNSLNENNSATLDNLIGKRIGISPLTSMHIYFCHLADDYEIPLDNFQLIFLEKDEIISAFENRFIDAAVIWEPWLSYLKTKDFSIIKSPSCTTNYTICCIAARNKDILGNSETLNIALKRYNHCVDLILNNEINYKQLLSLQFNLPLTIMKRALKTFEFYRLDEETYEKNIGFWRDYVQKEIKYLTKLNLITKDFNFEKFWALTDINCINSQSDKLQKPIAVSIQESISCTPFIVGKFLGLMS